MNEELQNTLNKLSKQHLDLKKQIEDLTFKDDAVKNQIKIICESEDIDYFKDGDNYSIKITEQSQTRLDRKLVEKMLPEEQFGQCLKEGKPFTTIRWKAPVGDE